MDLPQIKVLSELNGLSLQVGDPNRDISDLLRAIKVVDISAFCPSLEEGMLALVLYAKNSKGATGFQLRQLRIGSGASGFGVGAFSAYNRATGVLSIRSDAHVLSFLTSWGANLTTLATLVIENAPT